MRISAAILDVASGRVLGEVSVEGGDPAQRIVPLTDSLTVALLRELGRTRPIGAVRFASLGALTSLPALKDFLRGEQFYRRTAWDSAIAHYERALEKDSTFALALQRMSEAWGWQGFAGDSVSLVYALRPGSHNRGLSPHNSLLVAADSLGAAAHLAFEDTIFRATDYLATCGPVICSPE